MLYKSVFRHFKRRRLQVILLSVIIILSAFVYVVMAYSVSALRGPTEQFFEDYRQEHFHVTMAGQLTPDDFVMIDPAYGQARTLSELYRLDLESFDAVIDERIRLFEDAYPLVETEARLYKDIRHQPSDMQQIIRFIKDGNRINLSYITVGDKPVAANDIALTEAYATSHGIGIGDDFQLEGKTYTVTGYVLFPDYSLALFDDGFILNNSTRTLALVSDEAFHDLGSDVQVRLGGMFIEDVNRNTYFSSHEGLPFVLQIALTENTMRSGAIYDELAGGEAMGLLLGLIIASMAVLTVAIMVSRMLHEQRGAIGILKALGYRNREIAIPYILLVIMLSLPGLVIGYVLGFMAAEPMKRAYQAFYLLPEAPIHHTWQVFLTSITLPLLVLMVLGYVVIIRLLREHPVALMNPPQLRPGRVRHVMPGLFKRFSLLTRLRHAYIWRHPGRLLVFATGVFVAVYLILMSMSMMNMFDKVFADYYNKIDVNYIGYCEPFEACPLEETTIDRVIEVPHVLLNGKSVTVVGLDADNQFHPLYQNGREITHLLDENGIIITKAIALEAGIKTGDRVTLSYGQETMILDVLAIQDEYGGAKAYMNRTALSLYLTGGQQTDLYTTVYAKDPLSGDYAMVILVPDLLAQTRDLQVIAEVASFILIVVSMLVGAVVILLVGMLSIEAYFYDISLFKVIGYDQAEIQNIFLNSYRLYVVLLFVITLPIALLSFEIVVWYLASQYGMIFPMTLSWIQIVMSLALTVLIFYVAIPISKRKISALSLQQALQIYQH